MQTVLQILMPSCYPDAAAGIGFGSLAIEHAKGLNCRHESYVLAKLVETPAGLGTKLLFTDKPNKLKRIAADWDVAEQVKIYNIDQAATLLHDMPFAQPEVIAITNAHALSPALWNSWKVVAPTFIVAAEAQRLDTWFAKWSRSKADSVSLIKVSAPAIAESFPDEQASLTDLERRLSPTERKRFLELEDVDVAGRELESLITWGRRFCPHYFEQEPSLQHEWLSSMLLEITKLRGQKLDVEGPRGSAKSTLVSTLLPLYAICESLEDYIILCADTTSQAVKYLESITAELEENELLAEAYPEVVGKGPVWNKNSIVTRNNIRIEALGAGKKIRGRRHNEKRPTLIIVDDPEGDDAAVSVILRERVQRWFTRGVAKAGAPTTNIVVIGTRLHSTCLTGWLASQPGWRHKAFRAIMKWPTRMDLWDNWERIYADMSTANHEKEAEAFYNKHRAEMDAGAELLWPSREPLYKLMCQRAAEGHAAFESEKQNNPIDPSLCEWPPELFTEKIWFDEWPRDIEVKSIGVDPSKGRTDKPGDYSAMVKLAKAGPLLYIEADLQHRDVHKLVSDLIAVQSLFQADVVAVEENMHKELLSKEIVRVAQEEMNMFIPVYPLDNTVNKLVRIRRVGPYLNMGACRFKRRSPGTSLLLRQLQEFPNSDHDDGPDAMEMAFRVMTKMMARKRQASQMQGETTMGMPMLG